MTRAGATPRARVVQRDDDRARGDKSRSTIAMAVRSADSSRSRSAAVSSVFVDSAFSRRIKRVRAADNSSRVGARSVGFAVDFLGGFRGIVLFPRLNTSIARNIERDGVSWRRTARYCAGQQGCRRVRSSRQSVKLEDIAHVPRTEAVISIRAQSVSIVDLTAHAHRPDEMPRDLAWSGCCTAEVHENDF